jgi:hypothetical protein
MSIEFGLWRVDGDIPQRLSLHGNEQEKQLKAWLIQDLGIIAPDLLLIGSEVIAFDKERIDLLAIDRGGKLYVIELKRHLARREAVAQVLDYGAWAAEQGLVDLASVFEKHNPGKTLSDAFQARFGEPLPDELDTAHELWIVCAGMDSRTEAVCRYLANHYELPINAVFVHLMRDGDRQYLARAWLRDPTQAPVGVNEALSTNREFYANFGEYSNRSWDEARKYGFISAGGGRWYSRTLNLLKPGDRVWVRVPRRGYVGVGLVASNAEPVDDFMVEVDGKERRLVDVAPVIARADRYSNDPETAEYVVRVEWIKSVPLSEAFDMPGFFGQQNTVARPRAESWVKTISRLREHFAIKD